MTYAWIIDKDHYADPGAKPGTNGNAVGMVGPRRATTAQMLQLHGGAGRSFRMFDDDDILIYEGRLLGDPESEDGFGPLDDFGRPNFGCTSIQYLSKDGLWEAL